MTTTNIRYDVNSPKPITSVRVLVNNINIAEYQYWGKTNLSDIKKITIPQSTPPYTISILAINNEWWYARQDVQVSILEVDSWLPSLLNESASVTKRWETQYEVVMFFVDAESAIQWGTISMTNWVVLKKFEGNIVSFSVQIPQELSYEVQDTAGNKKKWTIDVAKFVKE
jgi:hypothetical protein